MMEDLKTKRYLTHDELIERIFLEYKKSDKKKYTSLFLSSLSSNSLSNRSGLAVFAIMQNFPKHAFTVNEDTLPDKLLFSKMDKKDKQFVISQVPCKYCSSLLNIKVETELIEECFSEVGGLIGHDLLTYYYYLLQTNKMDFVKPKDSDFRVFSEILNILMEAGETDSVKGIVQSKIGWIRGFKSNKEQRQALLETLGYCGILETNECKGLLNKYTNLAIAPKKNHNSDWNYPVDFWLGKDGVNHEALKFWFGDYPELRGFIRL